MTWPPGDLAQHLVTNARWVLASLSYALLGRRGERGQELHEFYCPGCWSLLEVEAVPPGYPAVFDFEPDIDTFYADFLGRPPPGAG